jgi:hypothetical protein
MPTWGELQEYVRSKYTLNDDDEESFSLVFKFADERTQLVGVSRFTAFDKDWIEFRSYVCKEAEMSPKVALRKNEEFAIGALALDDEGDYCLLYSAQLDTLDPDEFDMPLQILATAADDLEETFSSGDEH